MPQFGQRSRRMLSTCHTELVVLAEEALAVGMDFSVLEGHRDAERQTALFHQGLSKVQWPNSKHNREPSEAFDIAPYPIDWQDAERFYHLAGIIRAVASESGLAIRWGGDWDRDFDLRDQSFMDLAHFEMVTLAGSG
jgi:peptidoglycan L-alanyl-D-glutamate endopeptidase CwlK